MLKPLTGAYPVSLRCTADSKLLMNSILCRQPLSGLHASAAHGYDRSDKRDAIRPLTSSAHRLEHPQIAAASLVSVERKQRQTEHHRHGRRHRCRAHRGHQRKAAETLTDQATALADAGHPPCGAAADAQGITLGGVGKQYGDDSRRA